ncbi:hypothetical protein TRIUR3_26286 [Triticum urartu]|uniref:Uncharacterized protein n=1 Tax=Triticum urartu TaxID=4572 RepID=M8ATT7_TRIUA|nr:hypothetical protein TRIUR3_26286 [Triticum urartu]
MASSSHKGKGGLNELVGPLDSTFLPPDIPSAEELDSFVPQQAARCASKCWLEIEKQYELYWFGAWYVERKEKKMLEEKQKKEHGAKH